MITMSSEAPLSKVIVALDCNNENDALEIANLLDPKLCNLKIGLELFISCGPSIVKKIHNLNYKIFLDLKLHDISNTVLKSINTIGKLGIWMTNIHSSGGKKMMLDAQEELRKVQKDCLLLGVTILTSLNDKDLKEIGFQNNVNNQVLRMASLCHQSKLNGIVCSAYEAKVIKENFPSEFICVCPGIRALDDYIDDQSRVMTPMLAAQNGADYIVVGRPITRSRDPKNTLAIFKKEFEENMR